MLFSLQRGCSDMALGILMPQANEGLSHSLVSLCLKTLVPWVTSSSKWGLITHLSKVNARGSQTHLGPGACCSQSPAFSTVTNPVAQEKESAVAASGRKGDGLHVKVSCGWSEELTLPSSSFLSCFRDGARSSRHPDEVELAAFAAVVSKKSKRTRGAGTASLERRYCSLFSLIFPFSHLWFLPLWPSLA